MSEPRRVVITGIGAITPIGLGVGGLWEGLRRRQSAVRCITRFDPVTVSDGMTSLRRGYTPAGLRALLAAAGVRATVERRPGYRLVATWRPAA